MFNRKMEYVIKSVPTDDKQILEDLLNEMSEEGWDLYTMHEVEGEEDDYQYNCIFMREKEQTDEAEPFDKIVRVNNFKSQMEKMLASSSTPYETCKEITTKIREQKQKIAQIKTNLEREELSARDTLNSQMSDAIEKLEQLKQDLTRELSPGVMYSRIGEEKFTVNLSEELVDIVSPDSDEDLLSETVKLRQKLTDELGYVLPKMVFQDDDTLEPYEFAINVHCLNVYQTIAIPEHKAFFKEDLHLEKKPKGTIVSKDIITQKDIWWIPNEECKDFWSEGLAPIEYITRAIEFVGIKYVAEILDYSDINKYITLVEKRNSFVVNNIIPDFITLSELKYIIINLIRERISIKDIDYIFEKINDFSDEPSKDGLLDKIRLSLAKSISKEIASRGDVVKAIEFSADTLDTMFKLTESEDETVIKVDGKKAGKLAKKLQKIAKANEIEDILLIVPMEIRHMTFSIFTEFLNNITVVAHEELTNTCPIEVVDVL